jgi:hypothetical protein
LTIIACSFTRFSPTCAIVIRDVPIAILYLQQWCYTILTIGTVFAIYSVRAILTVLTIDTIGSILCPYINTG